MIGAQQSGNLSNLDHSSLLRFGVHTLHESGGVGIGPIGMFRLESGADLFPGFLTEPSVDTLANPQNHLILINVL
jgi:hypothetical protein